MVQVSWGDVKLVVWLTSYPRDNLILRLDILIKKQSRHATEPRYLGLLKEAMAISGTMERCPTSASIASDTTVVSEGHDASKTLPELGWQTSCLRGPIRTPSRTPFDSGPPHPKDQVHLRHASLPQASRIPVPIRPKRLVDLRHLSPMKTDRRRPTARRSSGCSVRELVRVYESLDK